MNKENETKQNETTMTTVIHDLATDMKNIDNGEQLRRGLTTVDGVTMNYYDNKTKRETIIS